MNSATLRLGGTLASMTLLALMLPACSWDGHINLLGYTTAPNYDCTIKTVFVPMVQNTTMKHGSIEFDMTRAIVNEIQLKTPYRVVHSKNGADTELLICTLKKIEQGDGHQHQPAWRDS